MSFHSDLSFKKSQRLQQDGRTNDFYSKQIRSNGHSASSISPVRKVKSPKSRSKSRQRSSCSSPPIQAKKVTFFRNGDPFFKGVVLAISPKVYPSIDSLILDANRHPICDVSVLPKGIRYVFSTDGKRIASLDELQEGKGYVFSSTESFKPLQYGSGNPILLRSRLPASDTLQQDVASVSSYNGEELNQLEMSINDICNFNASKTIYVIRAGPRPRYTTKMTLNQETDTSLELVMESIEQNLMMCKGGIKHLCSVSGNKVTCLEDLFEEDAIFIAFATEVISPDDLLLSAAELSTSPTGTKIPSIVVWTNNQPRFPSDIKKPKVITVVNRGHAGDDRGIPFALLSKYRVCKTVIWTDCAVMKRCYTKTDSRQAVAMKIFDKSRLPNDELDAVYYELSMLRRLKHNNILHFFDEMDTIPELYVLVEYFMGTNLLDAILLSEFFTEKEAASLMAQLCSAINYLHSLSIIHRDIKPENILVSCDSHVEDWHLRLVGLASAVQIKEDSLSELCGTLEYAAPEMLQGLRYGSKVDMWSAGVVCYQMLCGLLPFTCSEASGDQQQLIQSILSGHVDFPSPYWDLISDSVKDLILHMLTRNPKLRCKASDVFSHSWLQTTRSHSPTYRGKNVDLRNTVVTNLEISNPWVSKTAKSCHMLLASSFCSPRKAYEERTSSPDHETRLSFSSHSALSCSDSDHSLFKVSASPKGYRYTSCPSDVGANQNDATHGDTNPPQSYLDQDSLLPTEKALARSNNIESSGFDFNSPQSCMDQRNRVDVDSLKTAANGNFDSSHFCQDINASALTGANSSKSDVFSSHSVSTQNTSPSVRGRSAIKQPCSASTQTASSELLIHTAISPPKAPADNTLSSSPSPTTPSVDASNGNEVTNPEINSPRSKFPFPLSLLFSTVPPPPSATHSVKPTPSQNTPAPVNTDYQLMSAQMCSASLGLPSGHDLSSGRLTHIQAVSRDSAASSSVNPAHMDNCKLLPNQSLVPPSHGQNSSPPPVLTLRPSNPPSSSTVNHSGLPILQFVTSTKPASSPKKSQLKYGPSSSSSPPAKGCLASNLPLPQHTTQACQQDHTSSARLYPQYASSPNQDSKHIQTLPQTSVQSSDALTEPFNSSPFIPDNRNYTALQHGFSPRPRESNFHPMHRQSLQISHASTNAGIIDEPHSQDTHASPSQMLTAALKSHEPEDQGRTKAGRRLSANHKHNMDMAKVAVETVCWMTSKNLDKEQQTGKRAAPSTTSPARNKGSSPASSSSSKDEFLSPSSSIHEGSGNTSQTCLSDDNDDADSTSSWSTHCSINNRC